MAAASLSTRAPIAALLPEREVARLVAQFGLALAGTLLIALSAKVKVELGPVDLSLQTLAIVLVAAAFGRRLAVATLGLYLVEGLMGLPVFQGAGAGPFYMAGPTGGYLAGFVAMAAIVGWAADRGWDRSVATFLLALLAAEAAMMALGFAWLALLLGAEAAWTGGVLPFVAPDLVKVALAATLVPAAWGLAARRRG